jgi:hypothetical protein
MGKSKLTPNQVGRLQAECQQAKENMSTRHDMWRTVLDEYGMRNYGALRNAFSNMAAFDDAEFMASNARVPYVNLYVRKMLGMVAQRNNEYLLDPRKPDQENIASVLEFGLEKVVDNIGLEDKMVEVCLWGLLFGTGIGKVGYGSEMVYGQVAWSDKKPVGDVSEDDKDQPYRATTERNTAMSEGNPTMKVIPTFDYFKDQSSRSDDDLRREYVRYRRLLMDARMDPRYSEKGREALVGFRTPDNEYLGDDWRADMDDNNNDEDAMYCYVWEIVDIPSGMWCVVGENGEDPLIDWTPLNLPKGMRSPFIKCRLIPSPASFWGLSYAALMLPSAMSMNVVKAQTIAQVSRDGKKIIGYNPNAANDADTFRNIFQTAKHMQAIPINNLGETPGAPYNIIDFGGVNPELVRLQTMFANDLAQISQLTDQARNANGSEQTATEANIRNSQQQIGVSDLRSSFQKFHKDVVRAICRIMLKEWPQSKMVKVMGVDPRVYFWLNLDRSNVSDEFDIKIVMGTSEQSDRVLMRRQLGELAPTLLQITDRIEQQKQQQAAQQQPPQQGMSPQQAAPQSTVNLEGFLELLLDQYDPKFKNKILRKKDPLQMVVELVQEHGMQNIRMSPMLQKQVEAYIQSSNMGMLQAEASAQGGVTPQDNGTMNNNDGQPFQKAPSPQYAGMPMADSQAFQTGRAASEASQ